MSDTLKISLHEIIEEPISGTRPKGGVNFDGEIPSFGGENITMAGGLTYYPVKKVSLDFFNQMNRGQLQELDVLLNKDGANTGKSTIYRKSPYNRACINEHLFILRGKPSQLDQVYFHYLLQSSEIKIAIERKITGSAQPGLNSQFCRNFPLEIVPLPEQKRIASILTSVDEVIEKTQSQINKLQDLKKATMNELLTKGIGHTEFKDSELGRIPKSWEVTSVGQYSKSIVPGRNKPASLDGKIPWITITDLENFSVSKSKQNLGVDRKTLKSAGGKTVPARSVILSVVGEFGISSIADVELVINQQLHGFVCNEELHPEYLCFSIRHAKQQLERLSTQTTISYLNKENVESLKIVLPPLEEQYVIAEILLSIMHQQETFEDKLAQTQSLKKSLMQDLLTGKVRVEVN